MSALNITAAMYIYIFNIKNVDGPLYSPSANNRILNRIHAKGFKSALIMITKGAFWMKTTNNRLINLKQAYLAIKLSIFEVLLTKD